MLPIAIDAMGGDHGPGPNLAGAHAAVADGIPVVLVGPPDLGGREAVDGTVLDLIEASEVIGTTTLQLGFAARRTRRSCAQPKRFETAVPGR
jgi:fatty acid/phospholipid biosynthesis enzyme